MPLGISDSPPVAEMVEEGDQVTFKISPYYERNPWLSKRTIRSLLLRWTPFWIAETELS